MKIYLATWLEEPRQGQVLTHTKYRHRLLSYWHIKDKSSILPTYIRTGINKRFKKEKEK